MRYHLLFIGIFYILPSLSGFVHAQNKPNILWVITDDQRVDSNEIYNQVTTGTPESPLGFVYSPNINKLASEGVFYPNAYCNSPACAPSRGSIVTGKYPHHAGIYGFEQTHHEPDFFRPTLPQVMRDNQYQTAIFGKSGYRIYEWGPGVTWNSNNYYAFSIDMKNDLQKYGMTDYYGNSIWETVDGKSQNTGKVAEFYYPDGTKKFYYTEKKVGEITAEDLQKKASIDNELDILYAYTRESSTMIIGGQSSMPKDKTLDARITEEFISYLKNQDKSYRTLAGKTAQGANSSKPLFINLGYHLPHTPVLPPKEFRDIFKDQTYNIPEFDSEEYNRLPEQLKTIYSKMKIDGLKPEEKQQAIRDYYAFCAFGDYLIGNAVEEFKAYSKRNGQEYMIIYVCGDHGWHLGEQGIEAKFGPWEQSNHNSIIIASSDKTKYPAGTVYDGLVEFVDIMPTIVSAGGTDLSSSNFDYLDGKELSTVLTDKAEERDYVIGEINHVAGPRAFIRSKDFSFSMRNRPGWGKPGAQYPPNDNIQWGLNTSRSNVEMALYDLRLDAKERKNVANDTEYKALADWFRVKLGNIVLGDGRVECDWSKENTYNISNFAEGAHDKRLAIPSSIIPVVNQVAIEEQSIKLEEGETYQLNFQTSETNTAIEWSSNNKEVASVNQSGEVSFKGTGTAGIIARLSNGSTDICIVDTRTEQDIPLSIINNLSSQLIIYPNPFQETFNIKYPNKEIKSIQVFDISGKYIKTYKQGNQNAIGKGIPQGIYWVDVLTTEGEHVYQKIIKQ